MPFQFTIRQSSPAACRFLPISLMQITSYLPPAIRYPTSYGEKAAKSCCLARAQKAKKYFCFQLCPIFIRIREQTEARRLLNPLFHVFKAISARHAKTKTPVLLFWSVSYVSMVLFLLFNFDNVTNICVKIMKFNKSFCLNPWNSSK